MAQEIGVREVLEQINARFNGVEARFTSMEAQFTSMEARFDSLEARFERRFDSLERAIDGLRLEMHTNFRWTMGVIVTAWAMVVASVVGALIAAS